MNQLAVFLIKAISLFFKTCFGRACRFEPSCSRYSIEAFESFGFFKAFWMMARRLFSCHPFSPGGFDPVKKEF